MTFQPPPPPPPAGPPPGGPPSGSWGPPPGGQPQRPGFDPKSVNQFDWGILGAGLLAFIFSFTSYYTAKASFQGISQSASENAWHGFFGWFAMLLAVIGSALVAVEIFMPQVKLPVPGRLVGLGCYAVATLCVILALFIFPESVPDGIDTGRGVGFWISLIVIIVGLVLSLMRVQQTGGKLPGALGNIPNIGGQHSGGPAGRPQQGPPQGPPPGYAPPQAPPQQGPPQGPPPGYGPPPGPPSGQ